MRDSRRLRALVLPALMLTLLSFCAASPAFAKCISIAYYVINIPEAFLRSPNPLARSGAGYSVGQTPSADSVLLSGSSTVTTEISSGFYFIYGTLSSLASLSIRVTEQAQDFPTALNLWFDVDGDGEFFIWDSSGRLLSLGNDNYGKGPHVAVGFLTVDGSTSFRMAIGGTHTLAGLGLGEVTGIGPDTLTAVWIGLQTQDRSPESPGSGTSQVYFTGDLQFCNGNPVGGEVLSVSQFRIASPFLILISTLAILVTTSYTRLKRRN